jgi:hypothetical protein
MSPSQQAKAIHRVLLHLPEDLTKNLPKALSNMFSGSGGMSGDSLTFRITMEYEDMAIKVGDRVGMEINKVDSGGI